MEICFLRSIISFNGIWFIPGRFAIFPEDIFDNFLMRFLMISFQPLKLLMLDFIKYL